MPGKREMFESELGRVRSMDDDAVRVAILEFSDALDPEDHHVELPQVKSNGTITHDTATNATATIFVKVLRLASERGLDLLEADAETINRFMTDLASEPDQRRYGLVDHDRSLSRSSGRTWQTAFRAFYRFCTEPGQDAERPGVAVDWPADSIRLFSIDQQPRHGADDMPEQADLDALRQACIEHSQNTRRDLAFLELAAGTAQRVYAIVTLKIKHVHVNEADLEDDETPHIMLNPEIRNDGDKGAIEQTGRFKPIVTDSRPVRELIDHHPLQDPDTRARYGIDVPFEECYLFIGDLNARQTDPRTHWHEGAPTDTLKRRKANTATMPNVKTVTVPVNPHNWRHFTYTKSQDLPIDESIRRKVFGWSPGSDTGQKTYGHKANEDAGRAFAEAWREEFGTVDGDVDAVTGQVVSSVFGSDISPEERTALVDEFMDSDRFMDDLARRIAEHTS